MRFWKVQKSAKNSKNVCKQYKVGICANFFIYLNINGGEIIMADVTVQKKEKYININLKLLQSMEKEN